MHPDFKNMELSGGYFVFVDPKNLDRVIRRVKNTLVGVGANLILQNVWQAAAVLPGTFYLGLTNSAYTYAATLATVTPGEIVGNGYARQPITRSGGGWTVSQVNGVYRAQSTTVTFTASANWTSTWTSAFICDIVSTSGGNLFSVSGQAPSPVATLSGAGPALYYEYWLRG